MKEKYVRNITNPPPSKDLQNPPPYSDQTEVRPDRPKSFKEKLQEAIDKTAVMGVFFEASRAKNFRRYELASLLNEVGFRLHELGHTEDSMQFALRSIETENTETNKAALMSHLEGFNDIKRQHINGLNSILTETSEGISRSMSNASRRIEDAANSISSASHRIANQGR